MQRMKLKNKKFLEKSTNSSLLYQTSQISLTGMHTVQKVKHYQKQIRNFNNHPNIQIIEKEDENSLIFIVGLISPKQVLKFIKDCHKNSCWKMPAKIIKIETGKPISICIHNCIATDSFPFETYLKRIQRFANRILSPELHGFKNNLLKSWQKCHKKSGVIGTVFVDLKHMTIVFITSFVVYQGCLLYG